LTDNQEEPKFTIEPLQSKHERTGFSSGVEALDVYLHKQAGQDLRRRAAVPFVITPDGKTIAGYYTLSQFAVELDLVPYELAKRLARYSMISATLLGRLAVSSAFRGRRLGATLLLDALHRSLRLSSQVASAGVIVDAKDVSAITFYKKYGFIEMPKVERRFFLPMGTIEKLFQTRK
jgi:predicted GNAT family N-acyltransferase